ncbi:tetratricopeptide repeat protein [Microbulbifer agarilyticus]
MADSKSRSVLTIIAILLAVGLSQPVSSATWSEYTSENFVVYSDVSKRRVKKLISQLERFRYGVLKFTGKRNYPESIPVEFLYFSDRDDLRELTGPDGKNVLGYFTQSWDGPLMAGWAGSWSISGQSITFHEYVHHLLRSRDTLRYPRWYEEGFAELLASAELRGGSMSIGHAPAWRLYELGEFGPGSLSVRDILNPYFVQTEDNADAFYAKSWLLTHYLLLGELSGNRSYRKASAKYILDVANGKNSFSSFEKHTGLSIDEVENELRKYRNNDRLKGIRIEIEGFDVVVSQRKLSKNESVRILATRALDQYKDDAGESFIDGADMRQSGWEAVQLLSAIFSLHNAQSALGNMNGQKVAIEVGNFMLPEDVEVVLESLSESDYEIAGLLGHYYYDLASFWSDDETLHSKLNIKSMRFSQQAVDLNPESLRAYEYLWRAQNRDGKKVDAFRTMMAAYKFHPNHLNLNQLTAEHLLNLDRLDLAKPFLENVANLAHLRDQTRWAQKLLAQLDESTEK